MSRFEAGERILEITDEIRELLAEAMNLVSKEGRYMDRERARAYWYGHIIIALGGDHGYMGRSMCSMEDTARELMEDEGEDEDEEDES